MNKSRILSLIAGGLTLAGVTAHAQDDLMNELQSTLPQEKNYAFATFKSTRLIDGSSVECLGAGVLDFRISHRFGPISDGISTLYGVDAAYTKLSLDYGVTNCLMVGIGHSAFNREDDGSIKIKLLRQQLGGGSPVTITYFGNTAVETMPAPALPDSTQKWLFSNRLFFTNQLLIGKKFSKTFSLQIMPTVVHYNLVDSAKFSNNTWALGIGFRKMFSRSSAITAEYYYRLTNTNMLVNGQKTYNTFSIGYEVETGGHVFQLMVTNAQGLTERTFIGQATNSWSKQQLHIGFNISRVFTVVKPKGYKGKDWDDKDGDDAKGDSDKKVTPKKSQKAPKSKVSDDKDFKPSNKKDTSW